MNEHYLQPFGPGCAVFCYQVLTEYVTAIKEIYQLEQANGTWKKHHIY
jgi:hypothetical protein